MPLTALAACRTLSPLHMSVKGSEMNKARRKAERDMRVKGSEY